jgi:hypothetical protein
MKRSGQVGLVLMGAATFVATFAAGSAVMAWQKSSHAAQPVAQTVVDQDCTSRPDNQNCQPQRRGFAYYFYPRWSGWSWGAATSSDMRTREAALTSGRASYAPSARSDTVRSGFGSTARGPSIRVSAGG